MSKETYEHIEHCRNCRYKNYVTIDKGTTIDDALEIVACKNCGVKLRPNEFERQNMRLRRMLG